MATSQNLEDMVAVLEDFVGTPMTDDEVSLAGQIHVYNDVHTALRAQFREYASGIDERQSSYMKDLLDLANSTKAWFDALEREISLLKLALNSSTI